MINTLLLICYCFLYYSKIYVSSYHHHIQSKIQLSSKLPLLNHNNYAVRHKYHTLCMASTGGGRGGGSTKLDRKTCKRIKLSSILLT